MQKPREGLQEHFLHICLKLAQFISFRLTTVENLKKKKGKILIYKHWRETCETFAVKFCEESLHSEHAPSRDGAVVSLQAQLQPWAGCLVHSLLGPDNPISLVRFIYFPQSHLELSQVKITTRLTGRWNRPFFFKVWLVFTLVLYCHQLMSRTCPAACTEVDCSDGTLPALCSLSADTHLLSTCLRTSERITPKYGPCHNFTWVFTRWQSEQKTKIIGTQNTFTVIYAKCLNLVFSRRTGCKSRICQEVSCNCVIWWKRYFIQVTKAK